MSLFEYHLLPQLVGHGETWTGRNWVVCFLSARYFWWPNVPKENNIDDRTLRETVIHMDMVTLSITSNWSVVDDSKIDKINMIPFQNKKRIRSTWFMTTLTSSRLFLFFRKWLNCRRSLLYLLSHQKTNRYQSTILLKKKKRYWSPLWWTSPNTKLGGYTILYTIWCCCPSIFIVTAIYHH